MTDPLFYCATLPADNPIVISGDEAHHVSVQRFRAGDRIALFDGRGGLARGTIQTIKRQAVEIAVERREHHAARTPALDLYCAVPKGDRLAVLLDIATQLGMSRFTPVRWQRSVVEPSGRAEERWQRICLEACKQSRRLHIPEIAPLTEPVAALKRAHAENSLPLLAHPDPGGTTLATLAIGSSERIAIFIGPEGGLTEDEVAQMRGEGARLVQLGPQILRIEAAAVAALSVLAARTLGESA